MSIKFKTQEKGQPGVVGGGDKKFYATIAFNEEISVEELTQEIEKFSALSEPDIKGVIIALENVISAKLAAGHIVRMDQLGSFYPAISSRGEETEEEVTSHSIKNVKVNYRPGKRILSAMKDAGFKKV